MHCNRPIIKLVVITYHDDTTARGDEVILSHNFVKPALTCYITGIVTHTSGQLSSKRA